MRGAFNSVAYAHNTAAVVPVQKHVTNTVREVVSDPAQHILKAHRDIRHSHTENEL